MKELKDRNNQICEAFQNYATVCEIARHLHRSPVTIKDIIVRILGVRKYLLIRKARIRQTAKKYNYKLYLSKRKYV